MVRPDKRIHLACEALISLFASAADFMVAEFDFKGKVFFYTQ